MDTIKQINRELRFWKLEHRCARSNYSIEHCEGAIHALDMLKMKLKLQEQNPPDQK